MHICDVCVRSEWFALLNSWHLRSKLGWRVSPWLSCWETANISFYFVFTIYSRQIRKAVPLLPSICQTSTKLIQQHWPISWTSPLKWKRRGQARLYSYLVYCNDALWCIVTIYHIYCFFFSGVLISQKQSITISYVLGRVSFVDTPNIYEPGTNVQGKVSVFLSYHHFVMQLKSCGSTHHCFPFNRSKLFIIMVNPFLTASCTSLRETFLWAQYKM